VSTADLLLRLLTAAFFGAMVGIERESTARTAGVRTHAVVAIGAALFTVAGAYGFRDLPRGDNVDPARIAAQVAAGVGFIGAGAILRHGATVVGITTAASIWLSAAIGVSAGAGYHVAVLLAAVSCVAVLVGLRFLKFSSRLFGSSLTVVEVLYDRGHGTLGPMLRSLESLNGRVESLTIKDDDAVAARAGTRQVTIRVIGPPSEVVDRALAHLGDRDEVRSVSIS
jgi:putative Mg2+ transporter-C (MgtC) family protein